MNKSNTIYERDWGWSCEVLKLSDGRLRTNTITLLFVAGQQYHFRVAAENECGRGLYLETDRPITAKLPYSE